MALLLWAAVPSTLELNLGYSSSIDRLIVRTTNQEEFVALHHLFIIIGFFVRILTGRILIIEFEDRRQYRPCPSRILELRFEPSE